MLEHFYQSIPGYFTFEDYYRDVVGRLPPGAHCVEVGVHAGRSAAFLAVELANRVLVPSLDLVDRFDDVPVTTVAHTLEPVTGNVVRWLERGTSWDVAGLYQDATLDFVFLDAGHDFDSVRRDIEAWAPKVKESGILAGHDFCQEFPGVVRAVEELIGRFRVYMGSQWENGKYYPVWERCES